MISNEWTLEYGRRLNKLAIWFWRIFISGFFAMILGSVVYWNHYFFELLWVPPVLLFLWYFIVLGFLVISLKLI
ncbi:hypothetical protein [Enterococcus mundtii]|uniref:hypothetical protein n=1 Tax=Enterococcus mundtii TaxID=53346 RepID=UPI0008264DEA|nr:hypothetical protein [Enterococcus mundtii]